MAEYDPAKAHEYYERTKKLKGRESGKGDTPSGGRGNSAAPTKDRTAARAAAAQRVKALNGKLTQLKAALQAARAKAPEDKKPSSGESKIKEAAYNKQYHEKNKLEIANDRKAKARSEPAKADSASPTAAPKSVEEIETAIRSTLVQLKAAIAKLKTL